MASPMPDSNRLADDIATGNTNREAPLAMLLGEQPHPALTQITCNQDGGTVTLEGEVPTFYLKQLAQETAARIQGIRTIVNHIQVKHTPIAGR